VRTNEEMIQKIAGSEHNHEWIPDWYERVWKKWQRQDTHLHPVVPEQFLSVVDDPAPYEIIDLFF